MMSLAGTTSSTVTVLTGTASALAEQLYRYCTWTAGGVPVSRVTTGNLNSESEELLRYWVVMFKSKQAHMTCFRFYLSVATAVLMLDCCQRRQRPRVLPQRLPAESET